MGGLLRQKLRAGKERGLSGVVSRLVALAVALATCGPGQRLTPDELESQSFAAVPSSTCGDGYIDGTEACDDSNTSNSDGCSSACAVESGYVCQTNRIANPFFTSTTTSWDDDGGNAPEVNSETSYGGSDTNKCTEIDNTAHLGQDITGLIAGVTYRLSYYASRRISDNPNPSTATLKWNSTTIATASRSNTTWSWTRSSHTFTPTTDSFTFTGTSASGVGKGIILDNIELRPSGSYGCTNAAAPTAADDTAYTRGHPVTISVLANDTTPVSTYGVTVGSATYGTVTLNDDNTITYDPGASYPSGGDSFTYTITDNYGRTDSGTVTLIAGVATQNTPAVIKVGSFIRPSGASNTFAHGLGDTPKALILWTANRQDETVGTDFRFGLGITDQDKTSRAVSVFVEDKASTPTNSSRHSSTGAIAIIDSGETLRARATVSSWDSTNITLSWDTNLSHTSDVIHFVAISGSAVLSKVIEWTTPTTATNPYEVTGVGFQPTAVIHMAIGDSITGAAPQSAAAWHLGMGVMDASGNQWGNMVAGDDAVTTTNTARAMMSDASLVFINTTPAITKKASYVSMDNSGFSLNFSTVTSATASRVFSLALQGVRANAGAFNKVASPTNSQSVTTVGYAPAAVLFGTIIANTSTAAQTSARWGIGAADGTTEGSTILVEPDNRTLPQCGVADKTSKGLVKTNTGSNGVDATLDSEADVSLTSNGFSASWTTNETATVEWGYFALASPSTTAIRLQSFELTQAGDEVRADWTTAAEFDNLGFHLLCDDNGARRPLSPLVPGSALFTGSDSGLGAPRSYAHGPFASSDCPSGTYWLQDVDLGGATTHHGPVRARRVSALAATARRASMLVAPTVAHTARPLSLTPDAPAEPRYLFKQVAPEPFALPSQTAVKIPVRTPGLYRLRTSDLIAAGLPASLDPAHLVLMAGGQERPLRIDGDEISFYGVGADTPFSDARTHWIGLGAQPGARMPLAAIASGGAEITAFPFVWADRQRSVYFSALLNEDGPNFFGPVINAVGIERKIPIHHLAPGAGVATLTVSVQGVTFEPHQIGVLWNGTPIGTINFDGRAVKSQSFELAATSLLDGDNALRLVSEGGPRDSSLLIESRMVHPHAFVADDNALRFTLVGGASAQIAGFTQAAIELYDVSDEPGVSRVPVTVAAVGDTFTAQVTAPGTGERTLLAVAPSRLQAATVLRNRPSDWRNPANAADLVIIGHETLLPEAAPLIERRRAQGLTVAAIDIDDLYDEFAFGERGPQAIRSFLTHARATWAKAPRFVLLLGDASFDPRNFLGKNVSDLVPTKLIDTSLIETASDDWFGDLDDLGHPALAIGRLPARTPEAARVMIAKTLAHDEAIAAGQRDLLFLTDSNDNENAFGTHARGAEALWQNRWPTSLISPFAAPGGTAPNWVDSLNAGPLVAAYWGHGSQNIWRAAGISGATAATLTNKTRPSLYLAMTCLNGFFHDVHGGSLAEALMASEGGAFAVWASSGLTHLFQQELPTASFLEYALDANGTIGGAAQAAKRRSAHPDFKKTFILFGDPSARLHAVKGGPLPGQRPGAFLRPLQRADIDRELDRAPNRTAFGGSIKGDPLPE